MSAKVAAALRGIAAEVSTSLDMLRDLLPEGADESAVNALRTGEHVIAVFARVTATMTPAELHRVFGAPGDWGYDTPLGDALYAAYKQPVGECLGAANTRRRTE